MYESPIKIYEMCRDIQQNIIQDQEKRAMECICEYGINVDKEELIKALNYDRNQYNKGYNDALEKIRTEIEQIGGKVVIVDCVKFGQNYLKYVQLEEVLRVIDKYKVEGVR